MSPLAEKIASVLSPEHWAEWETVYHSYKFVHRPSGLVIHFDAGPLCFEVSHAQVDIRLQFWEPALLWWKARPIARRDRVSYRARQFQTLADKLQTEEERAIEELLR